MRKVKEILIMLVMVLTSFLSFGNKKYNSNNSIIIINNKQLKVAFNNVKKGQVITLKSDTGAQLYSELITHNGKFVKILDLSNLENGKYKIELEQDFRIIANEIKIIDDRLIYNKENRRQIIFKPVIRSENNLLLVSKIAFDKKPLFVEIYYEDEIIFSETLKNNDFLSRAYRLQKEIEGPYKVILYSNNRSYTHNFKI